MNLVIPLKGSFFQLTFVSRLDLMRPMVFQTYMYFQLLLMFYQWNLSNKQAFRKSSLRFNSKNILTFCYKCALVQKLSKQFIKYETKNKVDGPQTPFYINVIKRAKQNILTLKDHLSFFQERAVDLMEGLVILTWVDNAPSFKSLLLIKDQVLMKLNMKFFL